MSIKPIETIYNGYRFRSRIEARWSVFFKTAGIRYEYEPEGFDLDGVYYLPDFRLPELKCWVEIKGQSPTEQERSKVKMLCLASQQPAYILFGNIEVPPPLPDLIYNPCDIDDYLKVRHKCLAFTERGEQASLSRGYQWEECCRCGSIGLKPYYQELCEEDLSRLFCECYKNVDTRSIYTRAMYISSSTRFNSPRLIEAYTAARQARFEHGENGTPTKGKKVSAESIITARQAREGYRKQDIPRVIKVRSEVNGERKDRQE